MKNAICSTGCLRLELDENGESIAEETANLEDTLESDESEITPDQLLHLKNAIELFSADFARFQNECTKCKNFKFNGKASTYARILDRARKCLRAAQSRPASADAKALADKKASGGREEKS